MTITNCKHTCTRECSGDCCDTCRWGESAKILKTIATMAIGETRTVRQLIALDTNDDIEELTSVFDIEEVIEEWPQFDPEDVTRIFIVADQSIFIGMGRIRNDQSMELVTRG